MDLLPVIASILGTTSVSAVVTALLAPRSEAKRLKGNIADLKEALESALPESKMELGRALNVESLRLASLSLVRFHPNFLVITGFLGLSALLLFGFLLFNTGITNNSELQGSVEFLGTLILPLNSFSSWALLVGLMLVAIAVGVSVGFFRSMLLQAARSQYIRDCQVQHPRPASSTPTGFLGKLEIFDRWVTLKIFSFH